MPKSSVRLWAQPPPARLQQTETEPGRLLSLALAPTAWRSLVESGTRSGGDPRGQGLGPGRDDPTGHHPSVAFSHEGTSIFSGRPRPHRARTRLRDDRGEWRSPSDHYERVNSVTLANDGSILATGSSDIRFALRVFKAGCPRGSVLGRSASGIRGRALPAPPAARRSRRAKVLAVALLAPDGRLVAGGGASRSRSGRFIFGRPAAGALPESLNDHRAEMQALAFALRRAPMLATAGCAATAEVKLR